MRSTGGWQLTDTAGRRTNRRFDNVIYLLIRRNGEWLIAHD